MPVGHQLVLVRDTEVRARAFSGEASTWYGECQLRSRAVWPGLGVVRPERLFSLPGLQALSPLVEQGCGTHLAQMGSRMPGPGRAPSSPSLSPASPTPRAAGACAALSPQDHPRRERWRSPWQLRRRCQNKHILRSYVLQICCDCLKILIHFILFQFSCPVMSDSLQPHESQHTRPPCPSPTPRVYSNSCPLSR